MLLNDANYNGGDSCACPGQTPSSVTTVYISTATDPVPSGTALPVSDVTSGGVRTIGLSIPRGYPGTSGGALNHIVVAGTTLTKTTLNADVLPAKAYELQLSWPSSQGTFDLWPTDAYLSLAVSGFQANRNDSNVGTSNYSWTLFTPPSPSSPYTAISVQIQGAILRGIYTGQQTVTPTWQLKSLA